MRRILLILTTVAVLGAGGAYGVFAMMSGGGPDPVELSQATPDGSGPAGSLDGRWVVSGPDSFVGYRVREKLAFLPAPNDAVGRTSSVTGSMSINGLTVSNVDVTADLRDLRSDREMRDNRLRELGLETDRFPEARFVLTEPITFRTHPEAGTRVSRDVRGRLTLHGVTRDVTVPVRGQWTWGRIEVVGSLGIRFADYRIEQIRLSQVTTEDNGTMEFRLVFVPQEES